MNVAAPGNGLPVVAVVGRPNVGKSSLVNRVLGRREAIVQEMPGVTRDRHGFVAEWGGREFEIVDTGGLEPGADGLDALVVEQAEAAIATADVIVLVVDAAAGIDEDDLLVADTLRRAGKPVVVAANKVDDPRDEPAAATFYRLGLGDPQPLSALHGRGSGDWLDAVIARLPEVRARPADAWASIAIIGRPNVGKSSTLNALLGSERAIVDAAPGTTRDPVDSYVAAMEGRVLRIVDTAGMRRQVQLKDPLEYFGWLRSRRVLQRVDGVLLVVDAREGVTGHDQRIAQDVVEAGRACVIVLNKWDLVPRDAMERTWLERDSGNRLRWLEWTSRVRASALTKRGVGRLVPAVTSAIESHRRRLPTSVVNDIIGAAQVRRPHPRSGGKSVRVLYAVQASAAPPLFVLFTTGRLDTAYVRYLENTVRAEAGFEGTPLKWQVRQRARRRL